MDLSKDDEVVETDGIQVQVLLVIVVFVLRVIKNICKKEAVTMKKGTYKENRFRAIVLLVVLALFSACLVACAPASKDDVEKTATAPVTTGGQETTGGTDSDIPDYVNPAGVFPIATEEITLKFVVPQTPNIADYSTNTFTLWLEEMSGCKLEFDQYPMQSMEEKVQLSLASFTDLPDAYLGLPKSGSSIFNTGNVIRYGTDGQLIPLNDLIETYGVEMKRVFEEYSDGITLEQMMTSADGNIYYAPSLVVGKISMFPNKLWLNENWLNKLNLEKPTTTDELYNVLKAFKEQDPNGNNKADEIPLVGTDQDYFYAPVNYLLGSFVENNPKVNRLIVDDAGKLEYAPISDGWREGMKYVNTLTKDGLLSTLSFTQQLENLKQIVNDPNDICGGFVALGLNQVIAAGDEVGERYVGVTPVAGPDGVRLATHNPPIPAGAGVITSSSKYPEVVYRIFDLMLSDEGARRARYGEEGVDWVFPETGELDRFGNQGTIKVLVDNWGKPQNKIWWGLNPYINDKYNDGAVAESYSLVEQKNGITSIEYLDYVPKSTVGILIYSGDDIARANELSVTLDDYVKQTIARFAVGELDPNKDDDWNKYLKEYDAIGLDEFMTIAQKTYDSMMK